MPNKETHEEFDLRLYSVNCALFMNFLPMVLYFLLFEIFPTKMLAVPVAAFSGIGVVWVEEKRAPYRYLCSPFRKVVFYSFSMLLLGQVVLFSPVVGLFADGVLEGQVLFIYLSYAVPAYIVMFYFINSVEAGVFSDAL